MSIVFWGFVLAIGLAIGSALTRRLPLWVSVVALGIVGIMQEVR